MITVTIIDRGDKVQETYARSLTDDRYIFEFSATYGLYRIGEPEKENYGSNWYSQVSGKLDHHYLSERWQDPVEVILLTKNPVIETFDAHFNRLGILTRPLADLSPEEADAWLKARV